MERRLELISYMTPAIWVHLVAILLAAVIGAFVLWRRKGDARHKRIGRIWCALMLIAAISSFYIREINDGGLSPIHALSAWTIFSLVAGIVAIRMRGSWRNAVQIHRGFLQFLYATGILIAGGFTFLPHRLLGRLTFGETYPWINYSFITLTTLGGVWLVYLTMRNARAERDRL